MLQRSLKNAHLIFVAIIVLIVLGTFSSVVCRDFFGFDDFMEVAYNRYLTDVSPRGVWNLIARPSLCAYYTPVKCLLHMGNYALSVSMNPYLFHAVNLLIHLLTCCVIYALLYFLSGRKRVAFMTAALFAVHHIHIDPVATVSSRGHLLVGLFGALTMLFYVRSIGSGNGGPPTAGQRRSYFLSLASFTAGILAHPTITTLPLCLTFCELLLSRSRPVSARLMAVVKKILPLVAIMIAYLVVNSHLFPDSSAMVPLWKIPHAVSTGADLLLQYYLAALRGGLQPAFLPAAVYVLLAAGGAACLLLRRARHWWALGPILFLAALLPALLRVYPAFLFNERYLYLPSLGLYLLLAGVMDGCWELVSARMKEEVRLVLEGFLIVLVGLALYNMVRFTRVCINDFCADRAAETLLNHEERKGWARAMQAWNSEEKRFALPEDLQ